MIHKYHNKIFLNVIFSSLADLKKKLIKDKLLRGRTQQKLPCSRDRRRYHLNLKIQPGKCVWVISLEKSVG